MKKATLITAAALAFLAPAAASAQDADTGTVDTSYGEQRQDDNDRFPWGLLGLLGLAGLLPKKRRDPIVVDNRTDTPR